MQEGSFTSSPAFTIPGLLIWGKVYLIMVLICISVISDGEHFFICHLASCVSSLEKFTFSYSALFIWVSFFFFKLNWMNSLQIFWWSAPIKNMTCKYFFLSVSYLFILVIISSNVQQKLSGLMQSQLFIFSFATWSPWHEIFACVFTYVFYGLSYSQIFCSFFSWFLFVVWEWVI